MRLSLLSLKNQFQQRWDEEEWMDLPSTSTPEFIRALLDIQWVNRHLGGTKIMLQEVFKQPVPKSQILRILDLGTGSADIPIAIAQQARRSGQRIEITAIDLHPTAVLEAQKDTAAYPEITVIQEDALKLPYDDHTFDIVISSMFMHHLKQAEAVILLQEMARISRFGFVVNDLERHPIAYWSIRLLGALTGKGNVFMNDAPLSVLRGFQFQDLKALKTLSGLSNLKFQRRFPYRWLITWELANTDYVK